MEPGGGGPGGQPGGMEPGGGGPGGQHLVGWSTSWWGWSASQWRWSAPWWSERRKRRLARHRLWIFISIFIKEIYFKSIM